MSPLTVYEQRIADGTLKPDAAQRAALAELSSLYERIIEYQPKSNWLLSGLFGTSAPRPKGLYIYGGVGRGKSMLMDLFFDTVPKRKKERIHFHAFMQAVHADLHAVRQTGVEDAIRPVAEKIVARATLLCLDEMQITDITDAMLVGRLFGFLLDAGVVIVTTSNRAPDDLYKDGLNRDLFLPFIDLMKTRLTLHNLDSETDHRQNRLAGKQTYFTPLSVASSLALDQLWIALAGTDTQTMTLSHKSRTLTLPEFHNGVARASFADLCGTALGPGDYLTIAKAVRVLFITDIPKLTKDKANEAKRFVTLIDALYEARVKLIATAAAKPDALYTDGTGSFEFERTASRLMEMQAADWGNDP